MYPLAQESLTDAVASRRLHGPEILETILQVTCVHDSVHADVCEGVEGGVCMSENNDITMRRLTLPPVQPRLAGIRRHRGYPQQRILSPRH